MCTERSNQTLLNPVDNNEKFRGFNLAGTSGAVIQSSVVVSSRRVGGDSDVVPRASRSILRLKRLWNLQYVHHKGFYTGLEPTDD